jgi:integrase
MVRVSDFVSDLYPKARTMAVFKRTDSDRNWFIEFTVGGEMVRRSSGTSSKSEAKALEQRWRQELVDRIKLGKAPTITLGAACQRYYETVLRPTGKPKTLKRDLVYLDQLQRRFGAGTLLTDLKQHEIAKWRDDLVIKGELKPASANRAYGVLRAIINTARTQWHVDAPILILRQLEAGPDRVRYLTDADEKKLLLACPSHVADFITFLMDSGARKGEAENLTWDRIMWEGDRAVVRLLATDTKGDRARQVPLTKRASAILQRLYRKYHDEYSAVFMYERGGKTRQMGNVRKPFETALKRASINPVGGPDFHLHDLRHHFASRLAQHGATLHEIKELLGHSDIKMSLKYAHLCRSNLDRAVALLD